jgi:ABC-2 type transport system ATP-binding protein
MTEPALEIEQLTRRYGSTWALRDCSLRIPQGRVVALVGPNGAGKTTLLKLAVGLENPDAGRITVLGLSPTAQAVAVLPRIGFLAQERPLYRRFTVEDLFRFGNRLNLRWDQDLAIGWVRERGIPLDRPVGNLSSGQQAQVALAMVIAKRPTLLLLDEPVAGLDPLARQRFLQSLIEIVAAEKLTAILSSHIISELQHTCDHLVILAHGRIQLEGDIEELLRAHGGKGAARPGQEDGRDVSLEELVLAYLRRAETEELRPSA